MIHSWHPVDSHYTRFGNRYLNYIDSSTHVVIFHVDRMNLLGEDYVDATGLDMGCVLQEGNDVQVSMHENLYCVHEVRSWVYHLDVCLDAFGVMGTPVMQSYLKYLRILRNICPKFVLRHLRNM